MFDFGISSGELLLIAIVALLVVGPKDLPQLLRMIGRMMTKMRGMAREFQSHIDDVMRDTGVDEVKKEVGKMTDLSAAAPDFKKEADDLKKAFESSAPKPALNGASTNGSDASATKDEVPAPTAPAEAPPEAAEAPAAPAASLPEPEPEPEPAKATGTAGS